jgi:membrane fusion protein (multidrug efflux system)
MSNQNAEPVQAANSSKQRLFLIRLTVLFVILGVFWFSYWFLFSRHYESTDNAYVNGNILPVSSQVGGTVVAVNVSDTAFVKTGEPLVFLDSTDRAIALEEAKANLALVLRQTEQLYIKDSGLQATIQARELTLKQARTDLKRRQQAIHLGGISQEELTHAQVNFDLANSLLTTARSEWNANQALIRGTTITTHPNVLRSMAAVKEAYLALLRTTIRAPVSGYIAKRSAQVGQVVGPGTSLMAVVPLDDIWVDANFKEKQLQKIQPGQAVTLEADIYSSKVRYHGRVAGFSGGTGSAFSLLPAQNATGNWIKVVQRLPVRILLDADEVKDHPLRIGLSVEVTVDINSKEQVLKEIDLDSVNKTAIFNHLDKGADLLIAQIIKEHVASSELNNPQQGVGAS